MKRNIVKIAAGIAVAAIVATSFPSTEVLAAPSIFPSAGATLAVGNGISVKDIHANIARNAAKNVAAATHSQINGGSSISVNKASVVSAADDAEEETDTIAVVTNPVSVPQLVGENVQKVETPSSKAVNESLTVNGVSVVGSASAGAQIEVTENSEGVVTTGDEANPLIDVKPEAADVEEGEEDLTRTVIAQCDSFVNVRSLPDENSEVVGKLYKHSAGTWLGKEGDWYKIESGSVTGYVKGEFVVTGQAAVKLASEVGIRTAVVNTTTLKIREEPSTEATVLGMVGMSDSMTVVEETDEWVKVQIEEGDGWVSKEYVDVTTEFPKAESAAEEAARLKKEEEERRKANAAAQKATKKSSNSSGGATAPVAISGSGLGSQVASFACQFVGNPYVYGGTSLTNGTDCSGFTMGVYRNFGVSLPHSSGAQRSVGYAVGSLAEAQPGDILCYSGHVALYIGNGQIVHASTAATGIKISNASYRNILAIRRIF